MCDETLNVDFLLFHKFPGTTLLQHGVALLLILKTKIADKKANEGLLQEFPGGYWLRQSIRGYQICFTVGLLLSFRSQLRRPRDRFESS